MNGPNRPDGFWRRQAARFSALAIILVLYGFARLPALPPSERAALAARFAFQRIALPRLPAALGGGGAGHAFRQVNPSVADIQGWISAVGAGAALHDLDGDGLANDLCWVDTRVDRVMVAPVPGTGDRYPLFTLDPVPLPYDPATMAPMGCLPGDFNEDGLADLLVYYWGRSPVLFLRRAGAPAALSAAAFEPVELVAGGPEPWYTNALTSADVDGDGHLDLIVGNYFQEESRLLDAHAKVTVEMQKSMSHAPNGGRHHLMLWRRATAGGHPTAEFVDAADAFDQQTNHSWTLAVGAADLDGDGLPEIYFANDFGNDRLLHNRSTPGHPLLVALYGERTLTAPKSKVLGNDSFKGMGVDFADLNGDGLLDIYVSNIAQEFALQENHFVWVSTGHPERMRDGIAPYVDRSEELGLARSAWSWDARFADFDNDGVPEAVQASGFLRGRVDRWAELQELAMGNDNLLHRPAFWPHFRPGDDLSGHVHDPFFVRSASGRYFDLAADLGLGDDQVSRGIAIGDVDGDGRLDFVIANQWGDSYFFHNLSPEVGSFLGLDLRLPVTTGKDGPGARLGRPAVGAAVTVRLPDGRRLVGQVDGGSGHSGKRAPTLHFGLGRLAAGTPLRVDVRWRDSGGTLRTRTLRLAPGWHRVMLDGAASSAAPPAPETAAGDGSPREKGTAG
jgi:enediyne biosynthesis protein E4